MLPLLLSLTLSAAPPQPALDRYGDPLPYGAVARLGTLRFRAAEPGGAFALSPDGKILAIGETGKVRLWDPATGRLVRVIDLPAGERTVSQISYSAEGRYLAVGEGEPGADKMGVRQLVPTGLTVFDVRSSVAVVHLRLHRCGIRLAGFLDGGLVAILLPGSEQTLMIYDLATRNDLWQADDLSLATCTPDGEAIATVKGADIELRQARSGKVLRTLKGEAHIRSLAFSPDGKLLVAGVAVYDRGYQYSLMRWERATGKPLPRWAALGEAVFSLAFAPDGKHLTARGQDGAVVLYDATTGKANSVFPGREDAAAHTTSAFSPDGKLLAWEGAADGCVHLYDIAARRERHRWRVNPPGRQSRPAFSADSRTVLTDGPRIRMWDVTTAEERDARSEHDSPLQALRFGPDSRTLLASTEQQTIHLWHLHAGRAVEIGGGEALFWHHGRSFTTVGKDGMIRVRDVNTGQLRFAFHTGQPRKMSSEWELILGFSPSGRSVAFVSPGGGLRVWDLMTGKRLLCVGDGPGPSRDIRLSFSPDDRTVVGHDAQEGRLRLWDVGSGRPLPDPLPTDVRLPWPHFAFSSDGARLVWADQYGTVGVYDVRRGRHVFHVNHPRLLGSIEAVDTDAGLIVARVKRTSLGVWSLEGVCLREYRERDKPIQSVDVHRDWPGQLLAHVRLNSEGRITGEIRELMTGRTITPIPESTPFAFSRDGRLVALGQREVVIREVLTGGIVGRMDNGHHGEITALAFSPDSRLLATGSSDTTALAWDWWKACGLAPSLGKPDETALAKGWPALADRDARTAWRAMADLISAGEMSADYLRTRLKPVTKDDCRRVRDLLNDLDSDEYAVRVKARAVLEKETLDWLPLFDEVLAGKPSLHLYREVERLLRGIADMQYSPDMLRRLRAVAVLERIGTPGARRVLQTLAAGDPRMLLTREAKAALRRMG